MCRDALGREESAGAHFRIEHQAADGEALRDDDRWSVVSAWEWKGDDRPPEPHQEPLSFEFVTPAQRSYR